MVELEKIEEEFEQDLLAVDMLSAGDTIVYTLKEAEEWEVREKVVVPAIRNMNNKWISGKLSNSQIYMSTLICEEIFFKKFFKNNKIKSDLNIAIASFEVIDPIKDKITRLLIRAFGLEAQDYINVVNVNKLVKKIKLNDIKVVLMYAPTNYSICKIKELDKALSKCKLKPKIIVQITSDVNSDELCSREGIYAVNSDIVDVFKSVREARQYYIS